MPRCTRPQGHRNRAVPSADIFMSIKPEHIANIASGAKNHDFKSYDLPPSIQCIWFYTTAPISTIHYVAHVSGSKKPGKVPEDGGIGNTDFNTKKKTSRFGYKILVLWRLDRPITLRQAKSRGILRGPPQKYTFVSRQVCREWELQKQTKLFREKEVIESLLEKRMESEGDQKDSKRSNPKKISHFLTVATQPNPLDYNI